MVTEPAVVSSIPLEKLVAPSVLECRIGVLTEPIMGSMETIGSPVATSITSIFLILRANVSTLYFLSWRSSTVALGR